MKSAILLLSAVFFYLGCAPATESTEQPSDMINFTAESAEISEIDGAYTLSINKISDAIVFTDRPNREVRPLPEGVQFLEIFWDFGLESDPPNVIVSGASNGQAVARVVEFLEEPVLNSDTNNMTVKIAFLDKKPPKSHTLNAPSFMVDGWASCLGMIFACPLDFVTEVVRQTPGWASTYGGARNAGAGVSKFMAANNAGLKPFALCEATVNSCFDAQ